MIALRMQDPQELQLGLCGVSVEDPVGESAHPRSANPVEAFNWGSAVGEHLQTSDRCLEFGHEPITEFRTDHRVVLARLFNVTNCMLGETNPQW